MTAAAQDGPVQDVVTGLKRATNTQKTTVGDILDAFGQRAYGPLFFVIGLVALSPVGAIPGASIICGTLIVLLAAQLGTRSGAPWVPDGLRRLAVDGSKARRSVDRMEPYVRKLSYVTRRRYVQLLEGNALYLVMGALCILAISMYPLALVPWGVIPSAAGITVIGLGLLARDGVMICIGLALAVAAAGLGLVLVMP
ncbi:exopolysaccharide biosynthesis protein [Rhodovibrio salinarum]|uniref:Exopolysaccharide synthesis, ExoD n=1 Tax=Rhodovibrio salinarum TaxID=1087 RepID=A0A934UZD2_9PROT|nr:exopolysaccharide biosynthesis protein [Rhodovibrio salinarum]MBK1696401.1 hypothetical protein [Rhodovibrio salinarum]